MIENLFRSNFKSEMCSQESGSTPKKNLLKLYLFLILRIDIVWHKEIFFYTIQSNKLRVVL